MKDQDRANDKHHFIPRFFLDGFSLSGKVDVISRLDGKVRRNQSISNVASIKGLYSFTEGEIRSGVVEQLIATHFESPVASFVAQTQQKFSYLPVGEQRRTIAEYIALQHTRTPEKLRSNEALFDFGSKLMLTNHESLTDEELTTQIDDILDTAVPRSKEEVLSILKEPSSGEFIPEKQQQLRLMLESIGIISPYLMNRSWNLIKFDKPSLILGDHLILMIPREAPHGFGRGGPGYANALEVILPLSSKSALVLKDYFENEEIIVGTAGMAKIINELTYRSSYLEVYSHPSLTPEWEGKPLGARPLFTIESQLFENITNSINNPPVRKYPKR